MLTKNEFIVFVHLLYSDSIFHQKQNIALIPKIFRSNIGLTAWLSFMLKPMVKQSVFHYTSNIGPKAILLLFFSHNALHEYGHFLSVGVKKKIIIIWLQVHVQSHIPDIFRWMLTENEFIVFINLLYSDSIFHQKHNITLTPKIFRSDIGLTAWFNFTYIFYAIIQRLHTYIHNRSL